MLQGRFYVARGNHKKDTFRFTSTNVSFCFSRTFRFADYTGEEELSGRQEVEHDLLLALLLLAIEA